MNSSNHFGSHSGNSETNLLREPKTGESHGHDNSAILNTEEKTFHTQGIQQERAAQTLSGKILNDPQNRLFEHLFKNYNKRVRPVKHHTEAVVVNASLGVGFINELDEINQVLHANIWLKTFWHNPFLTWKPEHFGNITDITVPAKSVWLPDIAFVNEMSGMYNKQFYEMFWVAMRYDSTARWSPGGDVRFKCPMDVRKYPFDTQKCILTFEIWMSTADEVLLRINNKSLLFATHHHSIWEIIGTKSVSGYVPGYKDRFSQLDFHILLKRKSLYYVTYIMAPCFLLGIINLFIFILPPGSGEKISLGMTIILSYFVFLLLVADHLPTTSDNIPLFVMYLTSVIILSALSLVCSILVIYLHNNPTTQGQSSFQNFFSKSYTSKVSVLAKGKKTLCCGAESRAAGTSPVETQPTSSQSWQRTVKNVDRILFVTFSLAFGILTLVFTREMMTE